MRNENGVSPRRWIGFRFPGRWGLALGTVGLILLLSAASAHAYRDEEAERGAAVFARRCSTCHGDQGQGLTEEWRATWPPTHQNCWKANCHGPQPYPENGFTLPRVVPALIGPHTLQRFATAADLYTYIRARMPFHAPGSLPEADYRAVTAFLLQRHGIPADGHPFDPEAAEGIPLHPTEGALQGVPHFQWIWIAAGLGVTGLLAGAILAQRRTSKARRTCEPDPWLLEQISGDETVTRRIGAAVGRWLQPGDVIAVQGPLGAGKTRFIQGIAEGLGIVEPVQSPSFVLIQAYPLPEGGWFYHVDLYRLEDPEAVWDLGLWDLFHETAIIAIEWPERAAGFLPEPYLRVTLIPLGETARRIRMEAVGPFPMERLRALQARLGSEEHVDPVRESRD